MITSLLNRLLAGTPEPLHEMDARVALAALLVRLARSDNDYSQVEIDKITRVLIDRYGLSSFEATQLRVQAEQLETAAPDTVRFTRALKAATPYEEREGLMKALWSVALSDGARRDDEETFMRMVANLLGVSDVDSAIARSKVQKEI